jgi:DNA-binding MarR family transcriptional regulator
MGQSIEELIWEVRRLFRELAQAADVALAPIGITAAERALIEFLAREDAPITLSEVARKSSVSRQHVHQTLGRLDARWVVRTTDPKDARSVTLRLSKEGQAVWKRIRAVDGLLLEQLAERLNDKRVRDGVVALRDLRRALKEIDRGES